MVIAYPDYHGPRVEYITRVAYPEDHGSAVAGTTQDLVAGFDRDLAVRRRTWHLANGASSATVMKRIWTPSVWVPDNDDGEDGERHGNG
jgi:hypothetical protein